MRNTTFKLMTSAAAGACAAWFAAPAIAQQAAAQDAVQTPSSGLGEIIVTAQKRKQNIQDVPITITSLSGDQLKARGIAAIEDLYKASPGVLVSEFGGSPTSTTVAVRGVAQLDFNDHQESPIAVYVDGAYVSFVGATGTGLFDVDNLEVLRGPQGTLFGRNATGGLVQITTHKPTDSLDGYVQGSFGNYNHLNLEGAISDSIGEGLSGRVSVLYNRQDGFYKNSMGPDFGGDNTLNARVQLQYKSEGGAKDLLEGFISRSFPVASGGYISFPVAPNPANHNLGEVNSGSLFVQNCAALGYTVAPGATNCLGYVRNDGGNPWSVPDPNIGTFNRTIFGATNTFTTDFGAVNFTSVTNYSGYMKHYIEDDSAGPLPIFEYGIGYAPGDKDNAKQLTQEFRLSQHSSRMDWVFGLYALWIWGDYSTSTYYADVTDPYLTIDQRWHQTVRSLAAFGQVDYKLSDKLSIIAGLRGNTDYKSLSLTGTCDADAATCALYGSGPSGAAFSGSASHSDWSGRLQATYTFDRQAMVYAGVNRGNKAGAISVPGGPPLPGVTFATQYVRPEVLTAYEAGFKTSWLGDRLRLNGDAFYYDYSNMQAYRLLGPTAVIFNAKARDYGAEMDASLRPLRDTTISGGLSLLHTKVYGVTLPDGTEATQQQAFAPHASWNATLRQELPVAFGKLFLQGNVNHVDSYFASTVNEPATQLPSRTLVDMSAGWSDRQDKTSVVVSVTNLFDKAYAFVKFDFYTTAGYGTENLLPPRMVSVRLSRKF
jgi:iron complex outermembrane recepter protein